MTILSHRAVPSLRLTAAALGAAILCGCGSPGQYVRETSGFDATGAFQITNRDVVEPVDLGYLLLRYAPATFLEKDSCDTLASNTPKWASGGVANPDGLDGSATDDKDRVRLDRAARYFACRAEHAGEDQRRLARNALQERLLMASAQRCSAFKIGLQREFSRTNFGLGLLTTLAGTAGALVNSVSAAKNWAGSAAVASGMRAEYNQDFYANLAAHVVIEGVDKRRMDVYEQVQRRGQAKAYADYPVEAAIKDALYYHGQCSVAAGFQQASDAIRVFDDPGLNTGLAMVAKLKAANQLMRDEAVSADELLKRVDTLSQHASMLAGSRLNAGAVGEASAPLAKLSQALARVGGAVAAMQAIVARFKAGRPITAPTESEMGIQSTDFTKLGLGDDQIRKCRGATLTLVDEGQAKLALAEVATDPVKQNELAGEAAKADRQAKGLAEQAKRVADGYHARVDTALAEWSVHYAKTIDPKNADAKGAAAKLQAAIKDAPGIAAEPALDALIKLCGA